MTTLPVQPRPETTTTTVRGAEHLDVTARITAAARAELSQRPDELSMRAVARRAGVDPRELVRIVESREQLIATVMFEIAHDAHAAVRPALDAAAGTSCRTRLLALARAYRTWALANSAELWVLLAPRRRGAVDRASAVRAMRWFYGPMLEIFRTGLESGDIDLDATRATDRAAHLVHPMFLGLVDDLDPRAVSLVLSVVTGLQGHLVLESCGQLAAVFSDLERAYEAQVRSLLDAAGVR